ncbi:MAG: FAD-binding oxidoreductase, partial [Deltaproteobacteria bacterium]|nr:FAD-binding oxidoreductase [Deltaproteobacteria bacterium]
MTKVMTPLKSLAASIGEERVKTDPHFTAKYAVDQCIPGAVIFPETIEQVREAVVCADQSRLSLITWGMGTKMSMGRVPEHIDAVLCTSRMDNILDADPANLTVTVEAGVLYRDLQARLVSQEDRCYLPVGDDDFDDILCSDREHSGCFVAVDPLHSDRATMGGILAGNSSGPRQLLYGLPRDHVLGVRFVSAQGDIVGAGGKTVKNVSGYDMSKLMIGSMGTLGILCETTLRLLPMPEKMESVLLSFESLSAATAFTDAVFDTPLLPAAVEIMNHRPLAHLAVGRNFSMKVGDHVVAVALEAFTDAVDRMRETFLNLAADIGAMENRVLEDRDHRRFWQNVSTLEASLAGPWPDLMCLHLNYPISAYHAVMGFCTQILSAADIPFSILT